MDSIRIIIFERINMETIADLHPVVVHFPVALFIMYCLFEIISVITKNENLVVSAHIVLIAGVVSSIGAAVTGHQAVEAIRILSAKGITIPDHLVELHENYATITMWYFFAILGFRTYFVIQKKFIERIKIIFVILSIFGSILIFETGRLGGDLVYKFGIGTELLNQSVSD
ncbi:DUF2231 domain-containing protein [Bacteroidota bacterium]